MRDALLAKETPEGRQRREEFLAKHPRPWRVADALTPGRHVPANEAIVDVNGAAVALWPPEVTRPFHWGMADMYVGIVNRAFPS